MKRDKDDNWTAFLDGSLGVSELGVFVSNGLITLIEVTPSGSPMIATIKLEQDAQLYKSVYSRHSSLQGFWNPTQWYGECLAQ